MTKAMRLLISSFVAGSALMIGESASATQLNFSFTHTNGPFVYEENWTQSNAPTPLRFDPYGLSVAATGSAVELLGGSIFGSSPITTVIYYGATYGGGVSAVYDVGRGAQLFSGPTSAPIFSPGIYTLSSGVLTVTNLAAAVPEPATWAMMLAGLAGIGFMARRRRNITVRYA